VRVMPPENPLAAARMTRPAPSASSAPALCSALGAGIFIQGTNTIIVAPGLGQSLSIGDAIAEQSAGALLAEGAGRVILAAATGFSGGITLTAGTLGPVWN
jgi:hypothetical protein